MDNIILIGKWKTLDIFGEGGWVDGEYVDSVKIAELRCITNPMTAKTLKNYESGQYTEEDQIAYAKTYISNSKGAYVYMGTDKYKIDAVKKWDDSVLVKYLLKRCIDGQ